MLYWDKNKKQLKQYFLGKNYQQIIRSEKPEGQSSTVNVNAVKTFESLIAVRNIQATTCLNTDNEWGV